MSLPIHDLMTSLSSRRPLFHSEADFQHELAWEIRLYAPAAEIRLERPVTVSGRRMEIDLFVTLDSRRIAIELKYKTKAGNANYCGETFTLAQHAATPLGRYDTWRDVERLECLRRNGLANETWAIFLTNDSGYWSTKPARGNGAAFSLHETRCVGPAHSTLAWQCTKNTDSIGVARVPSITITETYNLTWNDFSTTPQRFRFLALSQP